MCSSLLTMRWFDSSQKASLPVGQGQPPLLTRKPGGAFFKLVQWSVVNLNLVHHTCVNQSKITV